jgi:hypothetical protein
MSGIYDYFTRNDNGELMEGFLFEACNTQAKLLFIMKEPHNTDGETTFWFRDIVNGYRHDRNGTKMEHTLQRIAEYVLGSSEDNIFKQCAYINLYPYDGDAYVNKEKKDGYWAVRNGIAALTAGKEHIDIGSKSLEVARDRIKLLTFLSQYGIRYIVTVQDLFDVITDHESISSSTLLKKNRVTPFRVGKCLFDPSVTVYEYYHPSAPCVSYEMIDKAIQEKYA